MGSTVTTYMLHYIPSSSPVCQLRHGSVLSPSGAALFLAISLLITYSYIQDRRRNPAGLSYPPGPKDYFIIGNLFDLPRPSSAKASEI
jgi:hypothetical protein